MTIGVEKKMYRAFGLNLVSELYFPELKLVKNITKLSNGDIEINLSNDNMLNSQNYEFLVDNELNEVVFHVPEFATFTISDGKKIVYAQSQSKEEDLGLLRLYLLGTCMGILLMQRGILPIHGSAIEIGGKAYAIIGHSGAGKSTLATVFLDKGFKLLSDDIIAIDFIDSSTPKVIPSYPQQKLWQASLEEFGMKANKFIPLYARETKYAIPVAQQFQEASVPLAGVVELVRSEEKEIKVFKYSGLEQLKKLYEHTYRQFLIPKLHLLDWHFKQSTKLLNAVNMFMISRPNNEFKAYEIAEIIHELIGGKEHVNKYSVIG